MSNITTVSFPGLGIGEFDMNKIAFSVFGRNIAWYGIIITCGIILGYLYANYRAKFEGIKTDDLLDYAIFVVAAAIVGARIYYVAFTLEEYDNFLEMIAIWNGGIAIYGAIIGGGIAAYVISRIKKINPLKMFDLIAPAVIIGQIIGRWGNFVNGEAYGGRTDLPWRMGIRSGYLSETIYVHPTFLYESLWNLIGFIIIHFLYKKKKFDGQIFYMYIAWYGFGRMFIELLRTDSLTQGDIRVSSLVGFVSFVVGSVMLIWNFAKLRKAQQNVGEEQNND
ncbi:MAG: prolipoprotein diacylglyceryl transferase [Clostridiales bacterium]|nr:prolipoprotein diacylglyceryl transferase [Clostridiales bacterium]